LDLEKVVGQVLRQSSRVKLIRYKRAVRSSGSGSV
jgi:hypothetical protein